MVAELNAYLVRYKKVYIPHLGCFELIQEQPRLDVASKTISAPSYAVAYRGQGQINQHQQGFQAAAMTTDWEQWGSAVARQLQHQPVEWPSIGILRSEGGQLLFTPSTARLLDPVPAQRVLREGAVHQVLVGDKETDSERILLARSGRKAKRGYSWIPWVVLGLALAFIIYWLAIHHFQPGATGFTGF